ncbi:MAG: ubiquinol-cytochrome c reductase iron-sulfur subunit [Planctomycetes bacterium]|nr:ubiquinol-cytochrome c reductase iron-sulfur subunit [Planctomycetota bacterium]
MNENPKPGPTPASPRRGFIQWLLGGLTALYAGCFAYPMIRFLRSGGAEEGGEKVTQITFGEGMKLKPGEFRMFKFGSKPGILIRHSEAEFSAFYASCTHLGCTVSYSHPDRLITCACHGGRYDPVSGKNVAGPPPKPLTPLKVEIATETLMIKV